MLCGSVEVVAVEFLGVGRLVVVVGVAGSIVVVEGSHRVEAAMRSWVVVGCIAVVPLGKVAELACYCCWHQTAGQLGDRAFGRFSRTSW